MTDSPVGPETGAGETNDGIWPYLGVGCLTGVAGLAAGGMIAVALAKIVGGVTNCAPDAETGAPCNWNLYWTWGARIGLVLLPTIAIWRMRRARNRAKNSDVRGLRSGSH
jgi:hypothetical protein